ncbi:DMT family transporter, partial [Desulfobacterales bacterium HSG17]|nr:DMT family transporter [Desulfobacterales bacterium HSG17]
KVSLNMPYSPQISLKLLLQLIIGAIMISFSSVFVHVSHVEPVVSAFYRLAFGSLFLVTAVVCRQEWRRLSKHMIILSLIPGFFFALDLFFYHLCIKSVGPGLGTIIPNFQVLLLSAAGFFFFGEKIRLTFVLSLPLAFWGLSQVVGLEWKMMDASYQNGILWGLAAAFCYAVFLLGMRQIQSREMSESRFLGLTVVCLISGLLLSLEVVRTGNSFQIPDLQSISSLLALGFFSQFLGWFLITTALPFLPPSLTGLILLLQPALAFVWDVSFFGKPAGTMNWIGLAAVLFAIYLGANRNVPVKINKNRLP